MRNEYLKIGLFLFLVLSLFFSKPIFQELSLVPAETLYHIDNIYKGAFSQLGDLPSNGLLFDLVFQMHPWQHFIHQSIQNGFIPLWNPYSLAGLPFLASDQSSIFEITKIFSYLFQISPKDLMLFSGFLQLFLAGFFTYLFTRNLKISKTGSLVSAFAFMFSGPVIVWLGYPLISTVIWLPFLLLCIDKIVKKPKKLWVGLFALAVGWQFFGGNPEISWFILFTSILYILFRLSQYRPYKSSYKVIFRKISFLVISLVLGLAIASIQIIPTLEFLKQSEALSVGRGGVAGYNFFEAISKGEWNEWHTFKDIKHSLENLTLLVYPDFFGNPIFKQYWGRLNYNEAALYIGIIPLIFVLIALTGILKKNKRRKEIIFWSSVGFICFGVFASLPIFRLIAYLPIFKFVAVGRLRFIFVFSLAILAGYGVDYFLKHRKKQSKKRWVILNTFYLATVLFIFLAVWIWKKLALQSVTQEMWYSEKIFLLLTFIFINIVLWLLLFSQSRSWKYNFGKGLLILLVIGELFYYGYNYHPAIPRHFVYPKTPAIQFLKNNIGNYRLTSYRESLENFNSSLLPNSSIIWNLQDIRGYEIIKIRRYEAFERHFTGIDSRFTYNFFDHKIFNILGVKYFVQGKNNPENQKLSSINNLSLVYQDDFINIYENKKVIPRAFIVFNIHPIENYYQAIRVFLSKEFEPEMVALVEIENSENLSSIYSNHPFTLYQSAKITNYSPNKIEIITETSKDGYLVLTDVYYPGWQAYLDGQKVKIYPTDIAFRGLFVPSGKHQVIFEYRPNSFRYSIYISSIALIVSLLLIIPFKKIKNLKKSQK